MENISNNFTLFNSFEYNTTLPPMFNHTQLDIRYKNPLTLKPHFLAKNETILLIKKPMAANNKQKSKTANEKTNPDNSNSREGKH